MSDERAERIAEFITPLRVKPGSKARLDRDFDPRYKAAMRKRDGKELLRTGVSLLAEYQERLASQDAYLQALDAGGKDGTNRHVMSGVNPQGVRVNSFKVPSAEELDHDYLWRYAQRLPSRGETAAFECRSETDSVLTTSTFDSRQMNWAALTQVVLAVLVTQLDGFRRILGTTEITARQFGWALLAALTLLLLWELGKLLARRSKGV
ncbi:cation transporting ATPase C-terminal domain-containing protein [Streptomyces sp. NPDC126514]|uniref:cation transporting ATPase C-terminal domain-containing protein n=1 Tax=Streptomyces sp. NPDC126514 TaxID=3155210 RepID=UPI003324831B